MFTAYIVFVSFVDTMAQLPILSPFTVGLGASAVLTGVILGSYSLVNMVGNLLVGPWLDDYGRRVGIIIGLVVAGVAVGLYAVAAGPRQLLLARILHGAGGAVLIPAVFAYAGDRSRPGAVGRSMGRVGAAIAVAATVGPALGGVGAARFGPRAVFVFLAVLLCATALVFLLTHGSGTARPGRLHANGLAVHERTGAGAYLLRIGAALRDPRLAGTYASTFGLNFSMGTLAYALPLQVQALGYGSSSTGAFFGIFSLCAFLLFVLPSNRWGDRFGFARIGSYGAAGIMLALTLLTFVASPLLIAFTMVAYGLGFGLMFPSVCSSVVVFGGPDGRGAAFGAFSAVYSLGISLGPVSAGILSGAGLPPYLGALVVLPLTQLLHHKLLQTATCSPQGESS